MPRKIAISWYRSGIHVRPNFFASRTMLWTLPSSTRALVVAPHRRYSSTIASPPTSEPLRILFCGSDDFSIASLRALHKATNDAPGLIESIHVLHRPAKPTGRGLKKLREVPIQQTATHELNLPTHALDTFTNWTPPTPINLIIAVSFGLFIPPRILSHAPYGGLNVHPSLLPDLRGPAPIEHALLKHRTKTGVSIQTLHPTHFDHGTILAHAALDIPQDATALHLRHKLALLGAEKLVEVLVQRKYVPPFKEDTYYHHHHHHNHGDGSIDHAPRLTKQDRFIDISKSTLADIYTLKRALGPPWCVLRNGKRVILLEWERTSVKFSERLGPGIFKLPGRDEPVLRAKCGGTALVKKCTYEGYPAGEGNAKVMTVLEGLSEGDVECGG